MIYKTLHRNPRTEQQQSSTPTFYWSASHARRESGHICVCVMCVLNFLLDFGTFPTIWYFCIVTVEHVLLPKNAMSPMGFDPGTSPFVRHRSTNWAKEISTNAVSRGGYESTTVPITLCREAFLFPLQYFHLLLLPFGFGSDWKIN